jgi:cysteinyl-tRNA synthetase
MSASLKNVHTVKKNGVQDIRKCLHNSKKITRFQKLSTSLKNVRIVQKLLTRFQTGLIKKFL